VIHPLDSRGNFLPNAASAAGRAKNVKHGAWLRLRGIGFVGLGCSTLGDVSDDFYRLLYLLAWLRAEYQDGAALAAAGGDARGPVKSVEQRRGLIFARQRSVLMLTCLRAGALRLSGKHWDRALTAEQRRAVAARDAADLAEDFHAPPAPSLPVVQAFAVG
jgi:hypothetical protein